MSNIVMFQPGRKIGKMKLWQSAVRWAALQRNLFFAYTLQCNYLKWLLVRGSCLCMQYCYASEWKCSDKMIIMCTLEFRACVKCSCICSSSKVFLKIWNPFYVLCWVFAFFFFLIFAYLFFPLLLQVGKQWF